MVYLNKGQFYPITLSGVDSSAGLTATKVKVSHRNTSFILIFEMIILRCCFFPTSKLHKNMVNYLRATKATLPKYLSLPWS